MRPYDPMGDLDPIEDPPPRGPKGATGGNAQDPSSEALPITKAEQGIAVPVLYGTGKVPLILLEKKAPTFGYPDTGKQLTAYDVGQIIVVDALNSRGATSAHYLACMEVVVAGTTGGASAGADLTVSADLRIGDAQIPEWLQNHAYVVGDIIRNKGNKYLCITSGTSANVEGAGPSDTASLDTADGTAHWARGTWVSGTCGLDYLTAGYMEVAKQSFVGALCEGEVAGGGKTLWWDRERVVKPSNSNAPGKQLTIATGPDALTQTLPAPYDQSGYQHTALLYGTAVSKQQVEVPAIAVELRGVLFGGAGPDVNPADILNDILTHARRGCSWPGSRVDTSTTGTGASGYRVYCDAFGLRFSLLLSAQSTALSIVSDLLRATNSDAVWSGGKLKVVPLGDVASTSPVFGATNYSPANSAAYNLGADDILGLIAVTRKSETDCYNSFPVEFSDRSAAYASATVEDPDSANVDERGALLRGGAVALPVIFPDGSRPVMLSRILAQRSLSVRNTYRFSLSWRYVLLEPCDVVTLTDSVLGLAQTPVRIVEMTEESDGTLSVLAEDYPAGVAAARSYSPQAGDGYRASEISSTASQATSVDGSRVRVDLGAVPAAGLTPSQGNKANLWPNPTSEIAPPTGGDTLAAEWAWRSSAAAYEGTYGRRISGSTQSMVVAIPARTGDAFYFEAWGKAVAAGANKGARLQIEAVDASGTTTNASGLISNDTTTWTKLSTDLICAAGTVEVRAILATGSDAAADAYFDLIRFGQQVAEVDIVASSITAGKVATGAITAAKLESTLVLATQIKVGSFAESGGNVSAGVILDGTASGATPLIRVAAAGIQVGSQKLSEAWFAVNLVATANVDINGASNLSYTESSGIYDISFGASDTIRVTLNSPPAGVTSTNLKAHLAVGPAVMTGGALYQIRRYATGVDGSSRRYLDLAIYDSSNTKVAWPASINFDVSVICAVTSGYAL